MPSDARVAAMVPVGDAGPDDYLIMLTRRGLIKRTPAAAFANVRGAIKNTAIKLLVRAPRRSLLRGIPHTLEFTLLGLWGFLGLG